MATTNSYHDTTNHCHVAPSPSTTLGVDNNTQHWPCDNDWDRQTMMTRCGSDNGWPQWQMAMRQWWRQADDDMMWQWWQMTTMNTDDHNNNGWCEEYEMGDDRQQHRDAALPHCPPHSLSSSTSISSKLDTYCPYASSYKTGPQPVEIETGWDRSFNRKKQTKTALNQLTSVQYSFLWFFNLGGLVLVSVLSNLDKRPDWTGLPSTRWHQMGSFSHAWHMSCGCHLTIYELFLVVFECILHQIDRKSSCMGHLQIKNHGSVSQTAMMHLNTIVNPWNVPRWHKKFVDFAQNCWPSYLLMGKL